MSPEDIRLVQASWQQVAPISETAAALFYSKLFELDPRLQDLFEGDMGEQQRRLIAMLDTAVGRLSNLGAIVPAVQALGRRHVDYGVRDHHYYTVGAALLWTLREGLGEHFTEQVESAWVSVYTTLADVMRNAARQQAA